MCTVCLHRLGAEMQQLRDLTHFVPFADQLENFQFAVAQALNCVDLAFGLAMGEFCDHLCGHCRAEIRAPIKNFADRLDHVGHRLVFHDIAVRSGTQRAQCIKRFVMHREHQNRQARKFGADILDQLNAIGAGQTEIDNRHVGLQFPNHLHRFCCVAGFTTDSEVRVGMNQFFEALPK